MQSLSRFQRRIAHQAEVSDSRQKLSQGNSCFQPSQSRSQASMDPVPERKVRIGRASNLESVRIRKYGRITICRPKKG